MRNVLNWWKQMIISRTTEKCRFDYFMTLHRERWLPFSAFFFNERATQKKARSATTNDERMNRKKREKKINGKKGTKSWQNGTVRRKEDEKITLMWIVPFLSYYFSNDDYNVVRKNFFCVLVYIKHGNPCEQQNRWHWYIDDVAIRRWHYQFGKSNRNISFQSKSHALKDKSYKKRNDCRCHFSFIFFSYTLFVRLFFIILLFLVLHQILLVLLLPSTSLSMLHLIKDGFLFHSFYWIFGFIFRWVRWITLA